MKNIFQWLCGMAVILTVAACSKEVHVNLDIPGADDFQQLYMPQANQNPIQRSLSITDKTDTLVYSAFLGGSQDNAKDVELRFVVDAAKVTEFNAKNGTSYALMPAGSYTLSNEQAVIKSGEKSTGALHIKLKTKGFMLPFQSYLLPVSIKDASARINGELKTSYYLITGSYAPGEVPREKSISFGAEAAGNVMFDFDGKLIRRTSEGNLLLYPANVDGTFGTPGQIGSGWNIFNMIFYYGGDRLIARWGSGAGDIVQYAITKSGVIGGSKGIGQGWGIFSRIVPFKGMLLGIDNGGKMTMYPLDAAGNFDFGKIKDIGSGWNAFTTVFAYKNSLIAIEPGGDMYQFPLSDTGEFGARKKVGSGWNMYGSVFAAGDDLLALDSSGDLWRYKFNPAGFWPLQK
ncbi:hypothetical protein C7T94_10970 [Pedobacter yulinensis]|uniref:DUF1735 domain-containing protein n=1 Tax=Pedobacter yulinensis TaxID=2126353 RepID=A0A2T3HL08_9SPHI|nr:DUF1735 domain-containing protein [Pedobacter yulinensis]PST83120.1 hypothetical protein C7T94_10970 [Pedobacter yulinensis]